MKRKTNVIICGINLFCLSALWAYGFIDALIHFKTAGKLDLLFCIVCAILWDEASDLFLDAYKRKEEEK